MKKIILATTALVSLGVASHAHAEKATPMKVEALKVTVSGVVDARAAFTHQDTKRHSNSAADRAVQKAERNFTTKGNVAVKAEAATDFGMKYGGKIEFEDNKVVNDTNNTSSDSLRMKRAFIYAESNMGRAEFGAHDGADSYIIGAVDATSLDRKSVGLMSDWVQYAYTTGAGVGTSPTSHRGHYTLQPSIYTSATTGIAQGPAHGQMTRANKISYFTPRVAGFMLGVSYAPDLASHGSSTVTNKFSGISDDAELVAGTDKFHDVLSGGLHYKNTFNNVNVELGVTGAAGEAKKATTDTGTSATDTTKFHDMRAMSVGAKVGYKQFALAASYTDMGKTGANKSYKNTNDSVVRRNSKSSFYTVGASYEQGPVGVSVTYMDAKRMKNKSSVIAVGADYKLAPGFTPYVGVHFFELESVKDADNVKAKNKGNVVMVGTNFTF